MTTAQLFVLSSFITVAAALAAPATKFYLVSGANKGQGFALCQRILTEHHDTHVFLCSRDIQRGEDAKKLLVEECGGNDDRVNVVQLDVTDGDSVHAALEEVQSKLGDTGKLAGVVSNAGLLWGYPLSELMNVCATGVKNVIDAFIPLVKEDGRLVVVTSGLGPLMHGYASKERQSALMDAASSWEDSLAPMIDECLAAYEGSNTIEERIAAFEQIAFPGGPFSESAPDFHMYGLAKMFGDAYMLRTARKYPNMRVTSVDPGLVYTDLILKMPKYMGLEKEETSAQSPKEGVEATMRLLFDDAVGKGEEGSGKLYALNKDRELVFSDIDKMPQKQE
jgi:NAD(P)-dependent dehydrogenase (short-subunit alcohol dehydrogenase family)